jgi:hypothetical protein
VAAPAKVINILIYIVKAIGDCPKTKTQNTKQFSGAAGIRRTGFRL